MYHILWDEAKLPLYQEYIDRSAYVRKEEK